MGITIAYRGRLADLSRIEEFEDRVLDLALEVGGQAQIWRTCADDDPGRVVRGVILNLAPGQETTSLLISPEGWLIGLVDIEDAECGRLTEPPRCFVKTQFGPLEGHVALAEMFMALRREFMPDLEVSDEGGYYPTRDFAELARRHSLLQQAITGLAEGLQRHGLSPEAAEDPNILLRHIERIAAQVHRTLQRPPEHPPVTIADIEGPTGVPDPEVAEALADEMFKHNRRQQERLQRAFEERRSRGEDEDTALEGALDDLGLEDPDEESGPADEIMHEEPEPFANALDDDAAANEVEEEQDPLLKAAMDLLVHLHGLFRDADARFEPSLRTLFQGAGDAVGGLAQALAEREEQDYPCLYGLRVTQLKRALRGTAFARGALYPLRPAMTREQFDELHRTFGQLEKDIYQELGRVRSEQRSDDL
jgi:hypothetical protein